MVEEEVIEYVTESKTVYVHIAACTYEVLFRLMLEEKYGINDRCDTGEFNSALALLDVASSDKEFIPFFKAVQAKIVAKVLAL